MLHFGCAILLLLTLPGQGAQALTADAGCQAAYDGTATAAILNNPCAATSTATCPASCNEKISEVETACAGKNVEVSVTGSTSKEVKTFASQKIAFVGMLNLLADAPCKKVLFDKGLTMATDCQKAYTFASQQVVLSDYCKTDAGGGSETSCNTKCQAAITKVVSTCKNGDAIDDDGTTFDSTKMLGLQMLGPSTCDYQGTSSNSKGSTPQGSSPQGNPSNSTSSPQGTSPQVTGSTSLAITERPLVFTLFLTMLAGLS